MGASLCLFQFAKIFSGSPLSPFAPRKGQLPDVLSQERNATILVCRRCLSSSPFAPRKDSEIFIIKNKKILSQERKATMVAPLRPDQKGKFRARRGDPGRDELFCRATKQQMPRVKFEPVKPIFPPLHRLTRRPPPQILSARHIIP
jgi:hypothetical protein